MSTGLLAPPKIGLGSLLTDEAYRRPTLDPMGPPRQPVPPITMDASEPFFIPFNNEGGFVFDQKPDSWFMPVLGKICELGLLPPSWDSYGARSIHPRTALYTVKLLLEILLDSDPFPSVVPTVHGGIQLEWHEGGVELEIDIRSPLSVDMSIQYGEYDEDFENVDFETIQEKLDIVRRQRC